MIQQILNNLRESILPALLFIGILSLGLFVDYLLDLKNKKRGDFYKED